MNNVRRIIPVVCCFLRACSDWVDFWNNDYCFCC